MRASLAGGDATPIATGQTDPYTITTDLNNVYWTNKAGGQVMKVAK
jgi:hypothetical protein